MISVSVLVISYHHEQYINECISSILNQTHNNLEIVVVDNSESMDCFEVINNHTDRNRFKAFKQDNVGTIKTLNRYLNRLSGEYFTFISGDDYLPEDSIEKRLKYLIENPQFPMVYGRVIQVDKTSREIGRNLNKQFKSGFIFNEVIRNKYHPPAMTYFFRKDIFIEVGMYDERLFYTEDKYILYKISSRHPIGFINDYVAFQRKHDHNLTFSICYDKQLAEAEYIINRYSQLADFNNIKRWFNLVNFSFFTVHDPPAAGKWLKKSWSLFYTKRFIRTFIIYMKWNWKIW